MMPLIEQLVSSTFSSSNGAVKQACLCSLSVRGGVDSMLNSSQTVLQQQQQGRSFDQLALFNVCRCLELTDNDPRYTIFAFGTGYLNVLGQAANLGCSAYLTADCINFMVEEVNGHQFSPLETLLTYASESLQSLV